MSKRRKAQGLSPTRRAAVGTLLREGSLERQQGGIWAYPGAPEGKHGLPAGYVGTTTIVALEHLGIVQLTGPVAKNGTQARLQIPTDLTTQLSQYFYTLGYRAGFGGSGAMVATPGARENYRRGYRDGQRAAGGIPNANSNSRAKGGVVNDEH